ncbi:unnamed protein product [Callosobruchus maculatus]|uniref:Uncharacterized protein n=1 Tax=Callosobruchus maculatus TaxID=64391 RepID=A0A653D9K7_CALMS|nr:unnamed protein product [Callosobruchus maculatus]
MDMYAVFPFNLIKFVQCSTEQRMRETTRDGKGGGAQCGKRFSGRQPTALPEVADYLKCFIYLN